LIDVVLHNQSHYSIIITNCRPTIPILLAYYHLSYQYFASTYIFTSISPYLVHYEKHVNFIIIVSTTIKTKKCLYIYWWYDWFDNDRYGYI